jgi:plastocyanin
MTVRSNLVRSLALSLAAAALLPAAALAAGGTISGKVEATPPKYLAETVVYLKEVVGPYKARTVTMDQKNMKFVPHLLTITAGDTVHFLNSDGVDHNVYSPDGDAYNLGMIKANGTGDHVFAKTGSYTQLCSVHPEMLAYVFVGQNPDAAAVDDKGHFKIEGVPPGTYKLSVWNTKLKAADQTVTVEAGKAVEASFSIKR